MASEPYDGTIAASARYRRRRIPRGYHMRAVTGGQAEPNRLARELFASLPDRYDVLAEVLSFGQNRRWRRAMVDAVTGMAVPPAQILDVATGTAGVAVMLAERSPAAVIGVDLSEPMLRTGRKRVMARHLADRISLVLAQAERLPFADASFDALTFTYLMRYVADPQATIRELARVVRPGGVVASLEFSVPTTAIWRAAWLGYTRVLLPLAGLATGGRPWLQVGRFLGPSISEHYRRYPIGWMRDAWRRAGLESVQLRSMSLGGGLVMSARKVR
jgi:demethylmenaquinone methyltransferase/2-methoxy-6-polyprenyl-1,4-benzoquinol methylase